MPLAHVPCFAACARSLLRVLIMACCRQLRKAEQSKCRPTYAILGDSRWFWPIPGNSGRFREIPTNSRWFRAIPDISGDYRHFLVIPGNSRHFGWFRVIPGDSWQYRIILGHSRQFRVIPGAWCRKSFDTWPHIFWFLLFLLMKPSHPCPPKHLEAFSSLLTYSHLESISKPSQKFKDKFLRWLRGVFEMASRCFEMASRCFEMLRDASRCFEMLRDDFRGL